MDQTRRDAERARARAPGIEHEASLLQERLRAGATTGEAIALAAMLGDPSATVLCPEAVVLVPRDLYRATWIQRGHKGTSQWRNLFEGIGKPLFVRAAIVALRRAQRELRRPTENDAIAAVSAWLHDPSDGAARYARALSTSVRRQPLGKALGHLAMLPWLPELTASRRASEVCRAAAGAIGVHRSGGVRGDAPPLPIGSPVVFEALRQELVPWLVGAGPDPASLAQPGVEHVP